MLNVLSLAVLAAPLALVWLVNRALARLGVAPAGFEPDELVW